MLMTLLLSVLKKKLDAELAAQTPIGGEVIAKKIARGVKMFGGRWELDVIAKRTA